MSKVLSSLLLVSLLASSTIAFAGNPAYPEGAAKGASLQGRPSEAASPPQPLPQASRTRAPAADWNQAAHFAVTQVVANPDPGAFTATTSQGPVNRLLNGGAFEPMVFRTKYQARGDSPDSIILNPYETDGWDTWREGFWDGAAVRVYRIENGQFVHVRNDTVPPGGHRASGWNERTGDSVLVAPGETHFDYRFDGWERPDGTYYFILRAVDWNGNESADSNWVQLVNNSLTGPVTNTVVSFSAPASPTETVPPAAPTNLTFTVDIADSVVNFTWTGVADSDLAGYRLYRSDYEPSSHRGYGIDLSSTPSNPEQYIRTGDMVFLDLKRYTWSRIQYVTQRVWAHYPASGTPPLTPFFPDETPGGDWVFAPHPDPVPAEFTDRGETCLHIQLPSDGSEQRIFQYNHAGTWQDWYPVLTPGQTYSVEVWLRQESMTAPTVTFQLESFYASSITPTEFTVDGAWKKYTSSFTPQELWEEEGSIGTMGLYFSGTGNLWIDNFRVYEAGTAFMDFPQAEYDALAESGLSLLRTHGIIKTDWGYTMDALTNPPGVTTLRGNGDDLGHNLASLFNLMKKGGVNPWLQVELFMDAGEWLGLAEYLAAPYDPATDTPVSKPWAYKRYVQGQAAPWSDEFDRILFELSNETWNGLFAPWTFGGAEMTDAGTGTTYTGGQVYGLYQEYVHSLLDSSPYSATLANKLEWVIGGWAAQTGPDGYGQRAATTSPRSEWMTVAAYNGGWDEGETPAELSDEGYFKALTFAPQAGIPAALELVQTLEAQQSSGAADYRLGTYEAGPGYALPNTITAEQEEAEASVMKSLAAGTATLDIFLANAYLGYDVQNFFTFSRGRNYWTSHARWANGGQAYPSWKALSLYNLQGLGDFLVTQALSAPTWDLPATTQRAALDNAPMAAVYATRQGSRYNLFVLSRKLDNYPVTGDDGYTPLSVSLPFTNPSAITLYKMTGGPRDHNLDADVVQVVSQTVPTGAFATEFSLSAATGADARGLPPGSTFLYVFEGASTPPLPSNPTVRVEQAATQADPSIESVFEFSALFSEPVTGLLASEVVVGGTAGADTAQVEPVPGSQDTTYTIKVSGMKNGGTVSVTLPAGAAQALSDGDASLAPTSVDNVVTFALPASGASLSFRVNEDAGVRAEFPDENYEGETSEWVREFGQDTVQALYLKFTPAHFEGHPVVSATLHMYVSNALSTTARVYNVGDNWHAITLTFANSPQPVRQLASLPIPEEPHRWMDFDVSDYVRQEIARDGTASLVMLADAYTSWHTSENVGVPELIVSYGACCSSELVMLTPDPLRAFFVGEAAQFNLPSAGGNGPLTWSQIDPVTYSLPPGLSLTAGGVISGTPTQAGVWPVHLRASDGSQTATQAVDVVVAGYGSDEAQIVLGGTLANAYTTTLDGVWGVRGQPQDVATSPDEPTTPQDGWALWTNSVGRTAYYQFDLADVNGQVISAALRMYYITPDPDYPAYETAFLHQAADTYSGTATLWDESGLNYTNAPPPGAVIQSHSVEGLMSWDEWDVSSYVGTEAESDDLVSFALTTTANLPWWATQHVERGKRPVLVIVYKPEPTAIERLRLAVRQESGQPVAWLLAGALLVWGGLVIVRRRRKLSR